MAIFVQIPKTPIYFHSRFLCMVSMIKGVEWCPNFPPNLPILHSTHKSGIPITKKQTKYGMINAPPPFCTACTGNRRKFDIPTAFPAIAKIRPTRVPHPYYLQSVLPIEGESALTLTALKVWKTSSFPKSWIPIGLNRTKKVFSKICWIPIYEPNKQRKGKKELVVFIKGWFWLLVTELCSGCTSSIVQWAYHGEGHRWYYH